MRLAIKIIFIFVLGSCSFITAKPEVGLVSYMESLQRYSQKLGYSVANKNLLLAEFYLHELSEFTEEIVENIPEYDGHKISELTKAMLEPALENLDQQLEQPKINWSKINATYEEVISNCNACHVATEHGYIKILAKTSGKLPYNQDFSN